MGCIDGKSTEDENPGRRRAINPNSPNARNSEDEEEEEEKFPDFEEIGNGKTFGEGVKKIPAYKCEMPYDKVNELREKFWKSRTKYPRVWKVIRECCETDEDTAVILLDAAEMACVEGDLRKVMLLTEPDLIFRVPNYCVCDPSFERDYDKLKANLDNVETKKIKIVLYYLAQNKNINLHVTNKTHVKKVKEAFAKKMEINLETHKIRLLYRGLELMDDNPLCLNNIDEMSKVQVMVCEK